MLVQTLNSKAMPRSFTVGLTKEVLHIMKFIKNFYRRTLKHPKLDFNLHKQLAIEQAAQNWQEDERGGRRQRNSPIRTRRVGGDHVHWASDH